MKKIINKIVLGTLAVSLASCTAKYEDINTNPYEVPDLSPDGYALGSAMNNLAGCVISPDVNTAQFTDCLLGGPMGGYFADSNAGFTETISNFNPKDDWSRVFLKSDKLIPTLYSNLSQIKIVSQNSNDPVPYAIARVIKVAAMHRVTDTYGPIPYSQIGANGDIATPYDSQEVTYNTFFDELSDAISILNEHQNAQLVPTADYIYRGNVKQWIRFANSLKLRLAIRIAYANPEKAKQMAEEAVNPANGGVIESNADNAAWNYFETSQNPIYVATRYNQIQASDHNGVPCLTGGDTHAAADIICYMNGYNDNRREKFFTKSEWPGQEYLGMRRGIIIPELKTTGHKYSGVNINPTTPLVWMNAAEVAFLRAEGQAIFNFNMGGSAESFYNQGIRLSFEQWEAKGAEEYLNDDSSMPGTYTDPDNGTNSYTGSLSTITIKWDEGASSEEKQERIIVQKWIANWILGNEAWADFRRTGYPRLIPVKANKSGGIVDSQKGARRMPYPLDEFVSNKENVEFAVTNYLHGADNMATNVWWDCK